MGESIRRIAITTGGGDAPGLNAVIRAIVLAALRQNWEILGIVKGYEGLFDTSKIVHLTRSSVRGITHVGGTILGPIENTDFNRGFAFMEPGDLLVLYTDGILEATNAEGDIYDERRLIEFVKSNISLPAFEIIRGLFAEIRDFAGSVRLQDDTTAVVIRRQQEPTA